jgi:hypothetical protein
MQPWLAWLIMEATIEPVMLIVDIQHPATIDPLRATLHACPLPHAWSIYVGKITGTVCNLLCIPVDNIDQQ